MPDCLHVSPVLPDVSVAILIDFIVDFVKYKYYQSINTRQPYDYLKKAFRNYPYHEKELIKKIGASGNQPLNLLKKLAFANLM